jgi:cation diffusion facilitator family transporter
MDEKRTPPHDDPHGHETSAGHAHGTAGHAHEGHGRHGHTHGVVDASIATSERGLWALKWSFVSLMTATVLQVAVVLLSHSVALLADTIHNFGDAATAIPLGIAFMFARLKPNRKFPYGYGRVEDLAGQFVVFTILVSAVVAGYESIRRLLHPQPVSHLWAVAAASVIGFLGNEGAAMIRLKVGREIDSAALTADGYHARTDGWVSLSVLFGALGVGLGFPLADPILGLIITVAILKIVRESAASVFTRMLDGVEPGMMDRIERVAAGVSQVRAVTTLRARWIGHRLQTEVHVAVPSALTVTEGHTVAKEVQRQLMEALPVLDYVTIHVDPEEEAGEEHHRAVVDHAPDVAPAPPRSHGHAHAHDASPGHTHSGR